DGYVTSINTDDAASAVVAALDAPAGIYNVGDEPVTRREFYDAVAAALGTRPARVLPRGAGKLLGAKGAPFVRSQRISSQRFRDATGWAPAYPSVREGLPQVVREMGETKPGSGGPAITSTDKVVNMIALGLGVVGPAIVLVWSFRKVQTPSLS